MSDPDCISASNGYASNLYPLAFQEHGTPLHFQAAHGWAIKRAIPESVHSDAMGCYPVFCCRDWSALDQDLAEYSDEIISLNMVTDPFGDYSIRLLESTFPDVTIPYKQHFVIDLTRNPAEYVDRHHRRNSIQALKRTNISIAPTSPELLGEWCDLYDDLKLRHGISGMTAFSRQAFNQQMQVPGLVVFRAEHDGSTAGMLLWYRQGDRAYYHLGAYSASGYDARASFALFWTAIDYFSQIGLRWLSLGAGAGLSGNGTDGLTRFKQGWATGTRTAYFCGRIFKPDIYSGLSLARGGPTTAYFPAYRAGEFS